MQFIADEGGVIVDACYRDAPNGDVTEGEQVTRMPYNGRTAGVRKDVYIAPMRRMRTMDVTDFAFDIQPRSVCFDHVGAADGTTEHTKTITLTNRTGRSCAFRVLPLAPCDALTFTLDFTPSGPVPPGLSHPITVRCTPRAGTRCTDIEGQLLVCTAEGCCRVGLLARYIRPALHVDPAEVHLGVVARGECQQALLTLTNTGSAEGDVRLSGTLLDALHAAGRTAGSALTMLPTTERLMLAPQQSRTLLLKYAPPASDSESIDELDLVLRVSEQTTGEVVTIRVTGRAGAQPVCIESPSIDFQHCFYGEVYSADVRLINTSNVSLLVTPRIECEAETTPFRFDPPEVRVQAGSDYPMVLYFTPLGVEAATLESVLRIDVQGQTTPLLLRIHATASARAPQLDRNHIDLGDVPLHEQRMCAVRVTNPATVPQWVGCVSVPPHISVIPPAMRLLPHETYAFNLCVVPRCVGSDVQSITLSGEYGDETEVTIALSGTDTPCVFSESTVFLPACTMQGGQAVASTILRNVSATMQTFHVETTHCPYLQVSPAAGTLAAGASAILTLFFTPPLPSVVADVKGSMWDDQDGGGVRWTRYVTSQGVQQQASWHATLPVSCIIYGSKAPLRLAVHCTMTEHSTFEVRVLHESENRPQKVVTVARRGTKSGAGMHKTPATMTQGDGGDAGPTIRRVFDASMVDERQTIWLPGVVHGQRSSCVFLVRNTGRVAERLCAYLHEPHSPFRLLHPPVSVGHETCPLEPDAEVVIGVQFAPREAGVYSDVLCLTNEEGEALDIHLAARCTVSTFTVTAAVAAGSTIGSSEATVEAASEGGKDAHLSFPVTQVMQTTQRTLCVHNLSSTEQEISVVLEASTGPYDAFVVCPLMMRVAAEGKASCRVLFYPKLSGEYSAVLRVMGGGQSCRVILFGVACEQSVYVYTAEEGEDGRVTVHMLSEAVDEVALYEGRSRELPYTMPLTSTRPSVAITVGSVAGGHNVECVVQREIDECGDGRGENEGQSPWTIEPPRITVTPGSQSNIVVSYKGTVTAQPLRFTISIDGGSGAAEVNATYYFICPFHAS